MKRILLPLFLSANAAFAAVVQFPFLKRSDDGMMLAGKVNSSNLHHVFL
jgi:hypothetical protein